MRVSVRSVLTLWLCKIAIYRCSGVYRQVSDDEKHRGSQLHNENSFRKVKIILIIIHFNG